MKAERLHRLALGVVACAFLLLPFPRIADAAEFRWTMQSLWQAGSINHRIFEDFCARVAEMSGGRLEITPLPVGAIVAYNETLDAISAGLLDGHQSGAGYFAGKDAAFALLADLNGGYERPDQAEMWLYYGGGLELARELYARYNAHYVGGVWWGVESIPAKRPIRSVDEFRGVKIRAPEGMAQDIFARIGAAPVNLPGAEVYTALERGVIDAADWGTLGMNHDLGYHNIARYPLYPGFHSMPTAEVAVNMDRWNALPEDLQVIVEVAVRDLGRDMIQQVALQDAAAAAEATAQGVELIDWSDEERRKFRAVAVEVWEVYAARSPMARRFYDSQVDFLRRIGLLDTAE